jgi:hypothetical protein
MASSFAQAVCENLRTGIDTTTQAEAPLTVATSSLQPSEASTKTRPLRSVSSGRGRKGQWLHRELPIRLPAGVEIASECPECMDGRIFHGSRHLSRDGSSSWSIHCPDHGPVHLAIEAELSGHSIDPDDWIEVIARQIEPSDRTETIVPAGMWSVGRWNTWRQTRHVAVLHDWNLLQTRAVQLWIAKHPRALFLWGHADQGTMRRTARAS